MHATSAYTLCARDMVTGVTPRTGHSAALAPLVI
jgi:hypothetical protein